MSDERYDLEKQNQPGYDWLGRPKDPEREALRRLSVDECEGCGPHGMNVRDCPIHGLNGSAPR